MGLEATTVFLGGRWGAKRSLVRLGLDPWMADAALMSAKLFGKDIYPWQVQGRGIGVACVKTMGLLFRTHHYIVVVSQ